MSVFCRFLSRHDGNVRKAASAGALVLGLLLTPACRAKHELATDICSGQDQKQIRLQGGTFLMGAAPLHSEEGPPATVTVRSFDIDRTEVTVGEFDEFVRATGYITEAERQPDPAQYPGVPRELLVPSSIVFVGAAIGTDLRNPDRWWRVVPGASWRQPFGELSDAASQPNEPVVHVSYADALAYAGWRERDLPTEAEWEFAARGGLVGARYVWGDESQRETIRQANTWQGIFPASDLGQDGYKQRVAPTGCFAPNGYGLYDMAGNVWEWTKTPFAVGASHTIKGGSFLCADNFCHRYRPSARQEGPPDTGSSHIGFRTVSRVSDSSP
jgi:formylglycine-generating enzyme